MTPRAADRLYLAAVAALALLFAVSILDHAGLSGGVAASPPRPSAGQPRDVDVPALERLIRRGHLSDQEALHAHPVDEAPGAGGD